jgi:H/ACA ribonucleoprotein complex subunit 3
MKLRKCNKCDMYTLKDMCPRCGSSTTHPYPPKFSPNDKYGKYRRELKKIELNKVK